MSFKGVSLTFWWHEGRWGGGDGGGGGGEHGGWVQPLIAEAEAVSVERLGTCQKEAEKKVQAY